MLEGLPPDEMSKLDLLETPPGIYQEADIQTILALSMYQAGIISVSNDPADNIQVANAMFSAAFSIMGERGSIRRDRGGPNHYLEEQAKNQPLREKQWFLNASDQYVEMIEEIEGGQIDLSGLNYFETRERLIDITSGFREFARIEEVTGETAADLINQKLPDGAASMTQERIDHAREVLPGMAIKGVFKNAIEQPRYRGLSSAENTLSDFFKFPTGFDIGTSSAIMPNYNIEPDSDTLAVMGISLDEYVQTVTAEYVEGRDINLYIAHDLIDQLKNSEIEVDIENLMSLDTSIKAMVLIDAVLDPDRISEDEDARIDAARQRIYGEELGISQEQMDAWKVEKSVAAINNTLGQWNAKSFECSSVEDFEIAAGDNEQTYGLIKEYAMIAGLDIKEENAEALTDAGINTQALFAFNDRYDKLTATSETGGPSHITRISDILFDDDSTGCDAVPSLSSQ